MSQIVKQTVILGGGFTGLYAARRLRAIAYPHSTLLVDSRERFCFKPLLYERFADQMDDRQVNPRFQDLLKGTGIDFIRDTVIGIDLSDALVYLASGTTIPYTNLVIAVGSTTGYFGIEGAKENALPFHEPEDAIALAEHLRYCIRQAIETEDRQQRQEWLTFVVIGGGPTGVELAATLADLMPNWYADLDGNPEEVRVILLSRSSQILEGDINDPLREKARESLQQCGVKVEISTATSATAIYPDAVEYSRGELTERMATHTALWTAGTTTHPLVKNLSIPDSSRDNRGRLLVKPTLQLLDYPEVFAGGDCASVPNADYPATAQSAHQQGTEIADNLHAIAFDCTLKDAKVEISGTFMKLGLEEAIANLFHRISLGGTSGHLIRQGAYMNILPTPLHDLSITAKWAKKEIFDQYIKS